MPIDWQKIGNELSNEASGIRFGVSCVSGSSKLCQNYYYRMFSLYSNIL